MAYFMVTPERRAYLNEPAEHATVDISQICRGDNAPLSVIDEEWAADYLAETATQQSMIAEANEQLEALQSDSAERRRDYAMDI
jgi:hypothetical protein